MYLIAGKGGKERVRDLSGQPFPAVLTLFLTLL